MGSALPLRHFRIVETACPDEATKGLGSAYPMKGLRGGTGDREWRYHLNAARLGRTTISAFRVDAHELQSAENTFLNVIFPATGGFSQRVGRKTWECREGSAGAVIPPHERIASLADGTRFLQVWLDRAALIPALDLIEADLDPARCIDTISARPDLAGTSRLREIVSRMAAQLDAAPELLLDNEAFLAALDETLVLSLAAFLAEAKARVRGHRAPATALLARCIDYIDAHLTQPISMERMARETGASLRAIQLAFRQHLDTTPTAVIRERRLDLARRRLIDLPDRTISEIAYDCGFNHVGEFGTAYRRRFGETPRQGRSRRAACA